MRRILSVISSTFALACADDLAPTNNTPTDAAPVGDGVFVVDATSDEAPVRFDLDAGRASDVGWDVAFKRYQVTTNGGASGPGKVLVAALAERDFDSVAKAPEDGWTSDRADGPDEGTEPDTAFLGATAWYVYDPATHILSPRELVYVVRTSEGAYVKMAITGYYDEAGTAGVVTFRAEAVEPPDVEPVEVPDPGVDGTVDGSDGLVDGSDGLADGTDGTDGTSDGTDGADDGTDVLPVGTPIAAGDAKTWTRLELATGGAAVVDDLAADGAWDVAFQRTSIRCNGGVSGTGLAAARRTEGAYDSIDRAPTWGFEVDTLVPNPGPPGSGESPGNPVLSAWYDYDPATHGVSPKDETYLLRAADGTGYYKFSISAWSNGLYTVRTAPIERDTSAVTSTVDASAPGSWTAFSFRSGSVVIVDDLASSTAWDVAFSGALVRTNGGTSGPGQGGAASIEGALEAPATEGALPVEDALAPIPGPPGSGETSQNAALSAWYDYDPATHVLSPKERVFAVRTAGGDLAVVQVDEYVDGVYTIRWRYAGAGQASL